MKTSARLTWFACLALSLGASGAPAAPAPAPAAAPISATNGARLVPQVGHNAALTSAAFAPDDRTFVTTSEDGVAILWHTATGAILRRLEGQGDYLSAAAFSADGSRVATASNDQTVAVWDAASGARALTLRGHAAAVRRVAWLPGGARLASADDTGAVLVWDANTGALAATLAGARAPGGCRATLGGARAATPTAEGGVTVWDASTGAALITVAADGGPIAFAALSADGAWLLTAGKDQASKPVVRDAATGKVAAKLRVHPGGVRSAAFSLDGTKIATVDEDGSAWIANAKTGQVLASYANDGVARRSVVFSADGAQVAVANGDGTASIWTVATGKVAGAPLTGPGDGWSASDALAFSHDGARVIGVGSRGGLWDPQDGRLVAELRSRTAGVWNAAFSPDGRHLATTSLDGRTSVWGARGGSMDLALGVHGAPVSALGWSPDSGRLVTGSLDQTALVWDTATGELQRTLRAHAQGLRGAWFSADGTRIVTAGIDGLAIVWDAATGAELRRFEGGGTWVVWAALTADNARLSLGTLDGHVSTWDLRTKKRVGGFEVGNALTYDQSADGRWLVTAGEAGPPTVWDTRSGKAVRTLAGAHEGTVHDLALSPDGARVATAGLDARLVVWDLATGKATRTIATDARTVSWSADGRWLLTAHSDATARLWDGDGVERAAILSFTDGTWAVVDPEGRFDASRDGEVDGLVWVIGGEPYALDQLRAHYYDPGLLAKILGQRQEALRKVPGLGGITPPPKVQVDGPDPSGRLRLKLDDRGGGVGEVFVRLNGSDVTSAVLDRCPDLRAGCTAELAGLPTWIVGAANEVDVYASGASGDVRSRGTVREVVASGTAANDPPDLWVIAVGTGDFAGTDIDLRYPPLDALKFAAGMRLAGERAFGADRTHIRVLSTTASPEVSGPASAQALTDLGAWLKAADPGDTLVFYLSGHGVSYADGAVDDYFYILPEASGLADLQDAQTRAARAWSGAQISALLAAAAPLKRAVILDTCAAGKFDGALGATRDLSSDAVRAHARAQERTGAWFLAGAAADKVSYEASRYSQGLLTYTLLEGMRGPALGDGDLLYVGRWFGYAEGQVPVYAQGIGGVQEPITRRGEAADFPIGELPQDERGRVPLALPRPVVVRASVVTADGRQDRLGVQRAINEALRSAAASADASFVLWDSEPSDDTWQVTGKYRETGGGVRFDGFLTRTHGAQVDEQPLSATGVDAGAVAAAVVAQVQKQVR